MGLRTIHCKFYEFCIHSNRHYRKYVFAKKGINVINKERLKFRTLKSIQEKCKGTIKGKLVVRCRSLINFLVKKA